MADRRIGKKYRFKRDAHTRTPRLDDLFQMFYEAKIAEGVSPRTLETYRDNFRFMCEYLDMQGIKKDTLGLTTHVIRNYITWMGSYKRKWEGHAHKSDEDKTVGLSPVTINTRIKPLKTMFNFLEQEGVIQLNPFKTIKKVREPVNYIQTLTEEQLGRLLREPDKKSYAGFRDYVYMMVLLDCFFRLNECLSLRETDINFSTGVCRVEGRYVKNRRTKLVPLSKATLKAVKELIKENKEFDSDKLFLTNYGEPINGDRIRDRVKMHAKNADIEIPVNVHLFRHTAATIYLNNGGSEAFLVEMMGLSDFRMIKRYTHPTIDDVKRQHETYTPLKNVISNLTRERKGKRSK